MRLWPKKTPDSAAPLPEVEVTLKWVSGKAPSVIVCEGVRTGNGVLVLRHVDHEPVDRVLPLSRLHEWTERVVVPQVWHVG